MTSPNQISDSEFSQRRQRRQRFKWAALALLAVISSLGIYTTSSILTSRSSSIYTSPTSIPTGTGPLPINTPPASAQIPQSRPNQGARAESGTFEQTPQTAQPVVKPDAPPQETVPQNPMRQPVTTSTSPSFRDIPVERPGQTPPGETQNGKTETEPTPETPAPNQPEPKVLSVEGPLLSEGIVVTTSPINNPVVARPLRILRCPQLPSDADRSVLEGKSVVIYAYINISGQAALINSDFPSGTPAGIKNFIFSRIRQLIEGTRWAPAENEAGQAIPSNVRIQFTW